MHYCILPETILRLVCLTHSGITSASNVAFKKTPETVKNKRQITDSGVCVQFLRKRKFMYVFDNYLRLLLVQYLVLYYRESETRKNDVLSSQFECCHLRSSPPPPRRSRSVYCQCTTTTNSKRKSTVIHHHLFLDHDVPKT